MDCRSSSASRSWRAATVGEILATAIASALMGLGVASALPPFQWLKELLGISDLDRDRLDNQRDALHLNGHKLPAKANTRRLLAKALNCPDCCSFWSGLAIAPIFIPIQWVVPCAVLAFVASTVIGRIGK